MLTALLLLILGALGMLGGFLLAPGGFGIALILGGLVLLWLGTVATLKHIGWF